jgi:hypothetical protein
MKVKGIELTLPKDSTFRRAQQFANKSISVLRGIGCGEDDVEVDIDRLAIRKTPATIEWWIDGHYCTYSYEGGTHAQNMFVVYKVVSHYATQLAEDQITFDDFTREFSQDEDHKDQLTKARELLGVDAAADLPTITASYKKLAKSHHPDMHGGDDSFFKEINHAHKLLKKDLE